MPLPAIAIIVLFLLAAAELAVLVEIADGIGVLPTLALLIGVGVVGMALVRRQGLATLRRVAAAAQANQPPVAELFDGACILAAGLLMLLPGFLSDVVGCALLLPPLRRVLYKAVLRRSKAPTPYGPQRPGSPPRHGPAVIEGEYEEIEPVDERRAR